MMIYPGETSPVPVPPAPSGSNGHTHAACDCQSLHCWPGGTGTGDVFAGYITMNAETNLAFLLNPYAFFAVITPLAMCRCLPGVARCARSSRGSFPSSLRLAMVVYLLFYAGSFEVNPRYSIQILRQ